MIFRGREGAIEKGRSSVPSNRTAGVETDTKGGGPPAKAPAVIINNKRSVESAARKLFC